ncbi:MAG: 23S rRNA (pseudouridine(1915)-N(3))-methyltransferase RlmH [Verrucomicrobiaceae bacterium]|nr:23S rRNA (pseudouridine(1915)-N(3))-methyltransferase RlmH [Verrucomicrobiaceae bacterium]
MPPTHMNWRIITVGKPAFPWAREAVETYLKRLQHYTRLDRHPQRRPSCQRRTTDAHRIRNALRIALDERGEFRRSGSARWIEKQHLAGTQRVCVLIGGADGHSPELREKADALWRLSDLTLQHEVALIVLLEQIYGAHTILKKKEPYHRE